MSGKSDVMKLLIWKIIQYVVKKGSISSNLVPTIALCATMYVRFNDVKKANEFAATAQALIPRIRDDKKNSVQATMVVCYVMCLVQPFRSLMDTFLQVHKDFKVSSDCSNLLFTGRLYAASC